MICVECGGIMRKSKDAVEYHVRGELLMINGVPHYVCDGCGEIEIDLEAAENLSDMAHELYRKRHGLLSPHEIRAIRKSFGTTQQEFERIINSGKTTVSRWENGSVMQPSVADTLLRVIRDFPEVFNSLVIKNKE